jgi:predicted flap endonuclease-1-like 5' DNA nuclease/HAMP domain-containing protein
MPYTLVKGLAWVVLALLIGGVIGWLLRSLRTRRQIARARATAAIGAPHAGSPPADATEMERLQIRLDELESIVVERDHLRAELESIAAERDRLRAELGSARPVRSSAHSSAHPDSAAGRTRIATPDVAAASVVLGQDVVLDDLCVIVGVGPAVESLCHRIGIRTWWDLAATEPSLLRTMLIDAHLAVGDSTSWPRQARLLAEGRWAEFKALSDELAAGRPSD